MTANYLSIAVRATYKHMKSRELLPTVALDRKDVARSLNLRLPIMLIAALGSNSCLVAPTTPVLGSSIHSRCSRHPR